MSRLDPPGDRAAENDASKRHFVLPGKRLPGLLFLLVLPVLALSGLTALRGVEQVSGAGLVLQVEFPRVVRYLKGTSMLVRLSNPGPANVEGTELHLDGSYLASFTGLTVTPDATRSDGDGLIIELDSISAGEERIVRMELRGNEYWLQQGWLTASAGDGEVAVQIGTLVLP